MAFQHGRTVTPEDVEADDRTYFASRDAMNALIATPPATAAGLRVALAYFLEWDDDIPDDTGEYLRAILGAPLLTA
jgi:hypothetical protein